MIGFASVSLLVLLFIVPSIQHPVLFGVAIFGILFGIFQYFDARHQRAKFNKRFDNFDSRFKR